MIRVTDYIANYIYDIGVKHVFLLTGGGMLFLSDGLAKKEEIVSIPTHHEQAAAMAAVGYAKYRQGVSVAYFTTGCGSTNAITGLLDAWQDNVPCIFISGQSKRKETVRNSGLKLRQLGVQEVDIISIVQPLTKYAVMINEPNDIAYHLDKALHLATSGRPGPVWLDIPLDVQAAGVEVDALRRFDVNSYDKGYKEEISNDEMRRFNELAANASRPVVIMGQGVRLSHSCEEFKKFIEKFNIPVVASRLGIDGLPSDHYLNAGRIGNKGTRSGNFAVQNADLVISIGSRLSVSSTGHEYSDFAREAKLIVIDIDPVEHQKNTVNIDLFINADIRNFLSKMELFTISSSEEWVSRCQNWVKKYPVCLPRYSHEKEGVNFYYLIECISNKMSDEAAVVSDAGSSFYCVSQGVFLKKGQRYITSGGQADMGFGVPAAIGVSVAKDNGEVIALIGDGSFQLNIQELQTIVHNKLPIKLFVINNDGYLSIRASQKKFCNERYIGTDSRSGLSFPELKKIAEAYGIKYFKVDDSSEVNSTIDQVLDFEGPVLCEVISPRDQEVIPSVAAYTTSSGKMVSKPLEDMYPFLDRDEFKSNMVVKIVNKED